MKSSGKNCCCRALAKMRGQFPEARLLLVGDGPERPRLEQEADTLGIRDRVCFAGYQPHPERFLQAMDVFALTSRSEGLPVSLLEAWAAGPARGLFGGGRDS